MKIVSRAVLLSLFLAIFGSGAQAATRAFTVEKKEIIAKSAEDLKLILLDAENTCEQGCRHFVPNVREIKIVETENPDHYFTWTYVDSVRDSSLFTEVTVSSKGENVVLIKSTLPSREKIAELSRNYHLSHQSQVRKLNSQWLLKENLDKNGKFLNTAVEYKATTSIQHPLIRVFGKQVYTEMRKSLEASFKNLKE